jgi:hypothetical protein
MPEQTAQPATQASTSRAGGTQAANQIPERLRTGFTMTLRAGDTRTLRNHSNDPARASADSFTVPPLKLEPPAHERTTPPLQPINPVKLDHLLQALAAEGQRLSFSHVRHGGGYGMTGERTIYCNSTDRTKLMCITLHIDRHDRLWKLAIEGPDPKTNLSATRVAYFANQESIAYPASANRLPPWLEQRFAADQVAQGSGGHPGGYSMPASGHGAWQEQGQVVDRGAAPLYSNAQAAQHKGKHRAENWPPDSGFDPAGLHPAYPQAGTGGEWPGQWAGAGEWQMEPSEYRLLNEGGAPAAGEEAGPSESGMLANYVAGIEAGPVGGYGWPASGMGEAQAAQGMQAEPTPLREPESGWQYWIEGLHVVPNVKSSLRELRIALQDPGIELRSLNLEAKTSPPGMSDQAMRVLLVSLAARQGKHLTVGGMSREELAAGIQGYAKGEHLHLSLGMAAILPPVMLRDVMAKSMLGTSYAKRLRSAGSRHFTTRLSWLRIGMIEVARIIFPSGPQGQQGPRTMHASGFGAHAPRNFSPSYPFHQRLYTQYKTERRVAMNDRDAMPTLLAALERCMDPWTPSLLEQQLTADQIRDIANSMDETRSSETSREYQQIFEWLADKCKGNF